MPRITDIKQQKRSSGRFSLYIDGHYSFSLGDLALSNAGLHVGQELTGAEVERWQSQALEAKAYNAAIGQLSYRRRSRREITDYLKRKEYDEDIAASVIQRLEDLKFIDDAAFASAWIADRQLLRPRSRRTLQSELILKGIDRDTLGEALSKVSEDSQLDALTAIIERKRRQSSYADPHKLMAYLARQGYGYDQIKKALARLDEIR
jgi:regulatory protein